MKISVKTISRACALAGVAAGLWASSAAAAGVFADFGGQWRGSGRVSDVDGRSETLTCKSSNRPSDDGIAMTLGLVCASDSFRVDFQSDLYTDGRALRGTWNEKTREVSGVAQGAIGHDVFNVTASAPGFDARIVVRVIGGRKLDVRLDAHGSKINHVEVSMRR